MYQVIILEDQEFIATAVAKTIQDSNTDFFVSHIFHNGEECLQNLGNSIPDIVLTDIRMPLMDGLTCSEKLLAHFPDVKIIILSGYEDFSYARKAMQLGVHDYLLKPFSAAELMAALQKAAAKITVEKSRQTVIDRLPTFRQLAIISSMYGHCALAQNSWDCISFSSHESYGFFLFSISSDLFSAKKSEDAEITLFCCCNIISELLENIPEKEVFLCTPYVVLFLPLTMGSYQHFAGRLESIQTTLFSCIHDHVAVSFGGLVSSFEDCQKAFESCLAQLEQSAGAQRPILSASSKKELEAALSYIQLHYASDICLQDVADAIYLSYNYLSLLFTQKLGISFSAYLTKIRIEKACELLKNPQNKIVDISSRTGYSNYRYFNHVFKKMTGITPTDYRKKYCSDYYSGQNRMTSPSASLTSNSTYPAP